MPIKNQKSKIKNLCALCVLCGLFVHGSHAQTQPATQPTQTAPTGKPTVIVVVAAEGAPEFAEPFNKAGEQWQTAAKTAGAHLITIGMGPAPATTPAATDRDLLKKALDAELPNPKDPLWLIFIGHGTADNREAKINLRGPDVSDVELAAWLKTSRRPIAVVVCTSSSGPFLNRLSAPSRIVITATRAGSEVNYSRFSQFLAGAVADPAADIDRDGQTSLLESFLAASSRTAEFYKTESRMMTEHALLDDNGDGLGVSADWFQGIRANRAPGRGAAIDGTRAHQWHLVMSPVEAALTDEQRTKRQDLELQIESLRARKPNMQEDAYYTALEQLLLSLGKIYNEAGKSQ